MESYAIVKRESTMDDNGKEIYDHCEGLKELVGRLERFVVLEEGDKYRKELKEKSVKHQTERKAAWKLRSMQRFGYRICKFLQEEWIRRREKTGYADRGINWICTAVDS
jgi:hypothetical protein